MTSEQREQLQQQLVQNIIDDMDLKTVCAVAYDCIDGNYDSYSTDELIAEINEYYPELLND
mgnify:CR=1 FL=1|tara:strand:- start:14772 stop:14954 length:183 start_codon:yes stop_codon:yes gene_type:complete